MVEGLALDFLLKEEQQDEQKDWLHCMLDGRTDVWVCIISEFRRRDWDIW